MKKQQQQHEAKKTEDLIKRMVLFLAINNEVRFLAPYLFF